MNGDDGMNPQDWLQLAIAGNEIAMGWYSLVTEKPLPVRQPTSLMGGIFGTDFGVGQSNYGQPTGAMAGAGSLLALAAVVLVAVWLLK